eukprot:658275-Prorocentrum_minimum.AAC.2
MSDNARVVIERQPLDRDLIRLLRKKGQSYARAHGNYIPALRRVEDLFKGDTARRLFLLFLSDGSPSDHIECACAHGVQVCTVLYYTVPCCAVLCCDVM